MRTLHEQARWTTRGVLLLVFLLSLFLGVLRGQTLTLTEAYSLLEQNYPVLRNAGLNDRILAIDLEILDLERKPALYLKSSATLQSETTSLGEGESLPLSLDLPLYSARAYGEVNVTLHDGGRLAARKAVASAEGLLANQQLEVERFALRDRVNQLFLGVMLNRERLALFETTLADVAARKAAVSGAVTEGAALESELLQLEVREVEIEAERDNVRGIVLGLLANLSTLTGRQLPAEIQLVLPELPDLRVVPDLARPESQLFALQRAAILANKELIEADTKPMVTAFAQAGLGLPNPLNLFDNGVAPYALGGINFQWKLKDWGKAKKQKEVLQLQAARLAEQEATLTFNLNAGNDAYLAEVDRLQGQILREEKIAALQARILEQLAAQLDLGVITAADYLVQVNAELRARQQLKVHETELQELQINFLNDRGIF